MSWKARNDVFNLIGKVSGNAYLVASVLADCHNEKTSNCFPSITLIEMKTNLSRKTVIRSINELEAAGLISINHGKPRKGDVGSNKYALHYECRSVKSTPCIGTVENLHSEHGGDLTSSRCKFVQSTVEILHPNHKKEPKENNQERENTTTTLPPPPTKEPVGSGGGEAHGPVSFVSSGEAAGDGAPVPGLDRRDTGNGTDDSQTGPSPAGTADAILNAYAESVRRLYGPSDLETLFGEPLPALDIIVEKASALKSESVEFDDFSLIETVKAIAHNGGRDERGRPVSDIISFLQPFVRGECALFGRQMKLLDGDETTDAAESAQEAASTPSDAPRRAMTRPDPKERAKDALRRVSVAPAAAPTPPLSVYRAHTPSKPTLDGVFRRLKTEGGTYDQATVIATFEKLQGNGWVDGAGNRIRNPLGYIVGAVRRADVQERLRLCS